MTAKIDLLTLQLFVAIVEEQSIAKAAEKKNIAASAVSRRISDIEERFQVELLHRHSKGIELRETGKAGNARPVHIPRRGFRLITVLRHRLDEGPFRVSVFVAPVGAGQLPVEINAASGVLAAGRFRIRRNKAVAYGFHVGGFVGREKEPRPRSCRRWRMSRIGLPR